MNYYNSLIFFSQVKYKEDLTWLKGIGCYAYDTPDLTLAEQNKTLYSKVYLSPQGEWLNPLNTNPSPQRGSLWEQPLLALAPSSLLQHETKPMLNYSLSLETFNFVSFCFSTGSYYVA